MLGQAEPLRPRSAPIPKKQKESCLYSTGYSVLAEMHGQLTRHPVNPR